MKSLFESYPQRNPINDILLVGHECAVNSDDEEGLLRKSFPRRTPAFLGYPVGV